MTGCSIVLLADDWLRQVLEAFLLWQSLRVLQRCNSREGLRQIPKLFPHTKDICSDWLRTSER
jgi:hypothetical protein